MEGEALEKRLAALEEKWLNGTITPAEEQEYARWYNELDTGRPLPIPGNFATGREELRSRMLENILSRTKDAPVDKGILRMNPLKWVAAAAVILLVAGGSFFLMRRSSPSEIAKTGAGDKSNRDVPPGGNKAILTLANGSSIMLDSAHNGTLAQQGNTAIIKTGSGQLAYAPVAGNNPTGIAYNVLTTPRGGQYQLVLPDGTKVWLDAASSIRYPIVFNGATRKVAVTGQVYFEVVHKTSQPFIVTAGGIDITDIGTSFNVNAYTDEPQQRVTLLKGAVGVRSHADRLSLRPGEQAEITGDRLQLKKRVDVNAVMAWKNGQFQLGATDFSALMRQLSRWYDVDIVYEGKVPEKKFGGSINRNVNLSRLMEVMHDDGIETKIEDKKLIIMK